MPGPLAAPLIIGGAQLLGSIFGNKSQQKLQRQALKQESRYTDLALQEAREQRDYERKRADEDRARADDERAFERGRYAEERDYGRGQYANYLGRLDPYRQTGGAALTRVSDVLSRGLPASVPTMSRGGMVTLKAPTGQIREVPEAQAGWYLSQGATRVE